MERREIIETLAKKANITLEEAENILALNNFDLLDSIIYLERKGKIPNNHTTTMVEVAVEEEKKEHYGGIGELIGRVFRFIGKVIKKGSNHYFEIRKNQEKPIRINMIISVLLLFFLFVPVAILLVVGLFCGYKYSMSGKNVNYECVNSIFEEASKGCEGIKKDFNEGYKGEEV